MTFIHIADLHASPSRLEEILKVLTALKERCLEGVVAFILFAGDFWDFIISNSAKSGFSRILRAFFDLQEVVECYMIYGTPTHEADGSLECFSIMPNVKVYDCKDAGSYLIVPDVKLTVIPEPRLSFFSGKDIEEKHSQIQKWYKDIAEGSRKDNGEKHHIVMFHGEIEGCTYQNGVEVGDGGTVMPLSVLDSMEADYIACGHIHGRMKVKGLKTPCWYSGSVPPKNFGETHCGGWIEITL